MELSYHSAGKKKREPFSAGGEEPVHGDLEFPGQVKGQALTVWRETPHRLASSS